MVEMVETAAILNQAGPRALVILDEIGRGTATFDGLSIAWAAIEHLHEVNRCRGLFATHYHELTALGDRLDRVANATVRVTEWNGEVVFLHEVVPGAADRSYGIQVAKLAGLPPAVVERARAILGELEKTEREKPVASLVDDLPLFAAPLRRAAAPTAPAPAADGAARGAGRARSRRDDAARGARGAVSAEGAGLSERLAAVRTQFGQSRRACRTRRIRMSAPTRYRRRHGCRENERVSADETRALARHLRL